MVSTNDNLNWFSQKLYEPTLHFDGIQWFQQFLFRKKLQREIKFWIGASLPDEGEQEMRSAAWRFFKAPIIDFRTESDTKDESLFEFFRDEVTNHSSAMLINNYSGVRPLSVSEIYLAEQRLKPNYKVYARNYFGPPYSGDKSLSLQKEYPYVGWLSEAYRLYSDLDPKHDLVAIDLTLPNKLLHKHFQNYLDQSRAAGFANSSSPTRKKPIYSEFYRLRLLPFIDLQIWQRFRGIKLKKSLLAELIYDPKEPGTGQRITEVTEPKAMRMQTEEGLNELIYWARQEQIPEGSIKSQDIRR